MTHKPLLLAALLLVALVGSATPARANPELPATLSEPSPGTWRMDWNADPEFSYFVQWSEDLETWHWYPAAIKASGPQYFQDTPTDTAGHAVPRFFFRLFGIDPANPPPWWTDSDGDGLPDDMENDIGTNPFLPDTDGDGMSDGDELDLGLDPNDSYDVEPLVENDPGAPVPPTASGIVFLSVTGNNNPDILPPVQDSKTETLAKDTAYLAVVAVESEEFPEFSRISSEWNDTFEWSLKINNILASSGSSHVNVLHGQWIEAVRRGSSLFGLRPLHYLHVGVVKPRHALRTADLFAKVGNVSDDALPTTLVLALIPVKIAPASGTDQSLGGMVPSNKLLEPDGFRFHFVTPKDSDFLPGGFAEFNVESPSRDIFDQLLRWSPDSAGEPLPSDPDNPLRRRVSRAAPGKFPLVLQTNPQTIGQTGVPPDNSEDHQALDLAELDAWVVWANGSIRNNGVPIFTADFPGAKTIDGRDTDRTFWQPNNYDASKIWQFLFEIQPKQIVENYAAEDLPALAGAKLASPEVPGNGTPHPVFGFIDSNQEGLGTGATLKWDVSRQMEAHILNPNLIPKNDFMDSCHDLYSTQTNADSVPIAFPNDPLLGNDDLGYFAQDNNPYSPWHDPSKPIVDHEIGFIASADGPSVWMTDIAAASGRTYRQTDSFREFARLQLPSKWFRISENIEWSTTLKIEYDPASIPQNPKWKNNGSTTTP